MSEEPTSLRVCIEGMVQGIGFRAFAVEQATRLGLDGWVRNRADGTVEALVSGSRKPVEAFIGACMKGPAGARVTAVDLHDDSPPVEKGFHLHPSL